MSATTGPFNLLRLDAFRAAHDVDEGMTNRTKHKLDDYDLRNITMKSQASSGQLFDDFQVKLLSNQGTSQALR